MCWKTAAETAFSHNHGNFMKLLCAKCEFNMELKPQSTHQTSTMHNHVWKHSFRHLTRIALVESLTIFTHRTDEKYIQLDLFNILMLCTYWSIWVECLSSLKWGERCCFGEVVKWLETCRMRLSERTGRERDEGKKLRQISVIVVVTIYAIYVLLSNYNNVDTLLCVSSLAKTMWIFSQLSIDYHISSLP